jgi:mannose-1-phosphate guanylyltransferase
VTRHAVILAGGSGTRLWPASRRSLPKQFLPFGEKGTPLIAAAIARARIVAGDRVTIVTADDQLEATRAVAPGTDILGEPAARNTAAAIGLAAARIAAADPDAAIVVLPADHHIGNEAGLAELLDRALAEVEGPSTRRDGIITIGIAPTGPETGYGYIEVDTVLPGSITAVRRFVEKPDRITAERYIAGGRHLWNAGIFIARASRILADLDAQLPATATAVRAIAAGTSRAEDVYPTLRSISFDHAVMEHARDVFAIPASVGWNDVGSWAALSKLRPGDLHGNALDGTALVMGSNNIVFNDDPNTLVAAIGVDDVVIVKSGDVILVVPTAEAQRVRELVDALGKDAKLAKYR